MQELESRIEELKIALLRLSPFLAFSLDSLDVQYVEDDHPNYITVKGRTIKIYRNAEKLKDRDFALLTVKAIIHGIMAHGLRARKIFYEYGRTPLTRAIARFAADVVAFRLFPKRIRGGAFALDEDFLDKLFGGMNVEWRKASMEELFKSLIYIEESILKALLAKVETVTDRIIEDVEASHGAEGTNKAIGGTEIGHGGSGDEEDIDRSEVMWQHLIEELEKAEEQLENVITKTITFGYWAGKEESDGIRQLLDDYLRGKHLPWNLILRRWLQGTVQRYFKTSWKRESRKLPEILPGNERFGVRIIVAVDVSFSITNEDYSRFWGEVLEISKKMGEVIFVAWDVKAKNYGIVRNESDVEKRKSEVAGYGGTMITSLGPVLKDLRVNSNDILVVLTDGRFYESERDIKNFLRSIKAKKVLVTTDVVHPGFDRVIKMEVRK